MRALMLALALAASSSHGETCAIGTNGTATFNWVDSTSAGATYTLQQAAVPGGPYTTVASGLTGSPEVLTGLAPGTYYWVLIAVVNGAQSAPTPEVCKSISPAPATNFTVT